MTEATAKPSRPTPRPLRPRGQAVTQRTLDAANDVGDRIQEGVATNPLAVLAGGIAVGLFAGALLPKTKLENRYLGPLGARLNESARVAALAAKDAGMAELTAVGLSRVGASEQFGKVVEGIGKALSSSAEAARMSRKSRAQD